MALEHWDTLAGVYSGATGELAAAPRAPIRIVRATHLSGAENGESRPERIELRQNRRAVVDAAMTTALRHEIAHQFLWTACPASAEDRLFHEAFAVATSGEQRSWEDAGYLSLNAAASILEQPRTLARAPGRRALARLLSETPGALPPPLARRLALCAKGWQWPPLTVTELSELPSQPADAFVVLSRHSGEVLHGAGELRAPLPFGSTLKPFVYAALQPPPGDGGGPPVLRPDAQRPEWLCSEKLPATMDARTALLRSCNGYFLDVARVAPAASALGAFAEPLLALGLPAVPRDMPEAIGLRARLTLSPLSLAAAYLLLAEARPDVVDLLRANAAQGTLSDLPASAELRGFATKTGTVRDARLRPVLGWIVAVDADVVAVMARRGKMPRAFAGELARALAPYRAVRANGAVSVQTFGLLAPQSVEARCPGVSLRVDGRAVTVAPRDFTPLQSLTRAGSALCVGGPWRVRFPGTSPEGRDYAGVFSFAPAPAYRPPDGAFLSERTLKARRGSDFRFRTTLSRYVAGVLHSEDAEIQGPARAALAQVVAHNAQPGVSAHGRRGACDTTHCQVFQGTFAPRPEDLATLARRPLSAPGWLPFSRGGDEPWTARRPAKQVERVLGAAPDALRFSDGEVRFVRREGTRETPFDSAARLPCELLRSPLKLPSCPEDAQREGDALVFRGRGEGHGEGLDVEAAKRSALGEGELLQRAYGKAGLPALP